MSQYPQPHILYVKTATQNPSIMPYKMPDHDQKRGRQSKISKGEIYWNDRNSEEMQREVGEVSVQPTKAQCV